MLVSNIVPSESLPPVIDIRSNSICKIFPIVYKRTIAIKAANKGKEIYFFCKSNTSYFYYEESGNKIQKMVKIVHFCSLNQMKVEKELSVIARFYLVFVYLSSI